MKSISVPAWEWYGWKPETITFPDSWDVHVQKMKGHDAKALKPKRDRGEDSNTPSAQCPSAKSPRENENVSSSSMT